MAGEAFFRKLSYSSTSEDWRTEREALRLGPGDSVLAVTGGGERILSLMLDRPMNVAAVDVNPWQNRLLQLKLAALRTLSHDEYVRLLGLVPGGSRRTLFDKASPALPSEARDFWLLNFALIEDGILYQGRWERYCRTVAAAARTLRGKEIDRLFTFSGADLDRQRDFIRQIWDRKTMRLALSLACSGLVSRLLLGDPAFFRNVDPKLTIGRYFYDRMIASLEAYPARENFLVSMLLRGTLPAEDLPPSLDAAHFEAIRAQVDRVLPVNADLLEYLEQGPAGRYTRFSLSNLPSYLDAEGFERLLDGVVHAAQPEAIVCIRQLLTDHRIPERLRGCFERDPKLEKKLEQSDRAFAYRFLVARVSKKLGA